jgi:hypothetical protein
MGNGSSKKLRRNEPLTDDQCDAWAAQALANALRKHKKFMHPPRVCFIVHPMLSARRLVSHLLQDSNFGALFTCSDGFPLTQSQHTSQFEQLFHFVQNSAPLVLTTAADTPPPQRESVRQLDLVESLVRSASQRCEQLAARLALADRNLCVPNDAAYELLARADLREIKQRIVASKQTKSADTTTAVLILTPDDDTSSSSTSSSSTSDSEQLDLTDAAMYHLFAAADNTTSCTLTRSNRHYNTAPGVPQVECFYNDAVADSFLAPRDARAGWSPNAHSALDSLTMTEALLERLCYNEHNTLYVLVSVSAHYWQWAIAYLAQHMFATTQDCRPDAARRLVEALYLCANKAQDTLQSLGSYDSTRKSANMLHVHFEDTPVFPEDSFSAPGSGDFCAALTAMFYEDYSRVLARAVVTKLTDMICHEATGGSNGGCCTDPRLPGSRVGTMGILQRPATHRQARINVSAPSNVPVSEGSDGGTKRRWQSIVVGEHVDNSLLLIDTTAFEERFGKRFGVAYADSVYAKTVRCGVHTATPIAARLDVPPPIKAAKMNTKSTPLLQSALLVGVQYATTTTTTTTSGPLLLTSNSATDNALPLRGTVVRSDQRPPASQTTSDGDSSSGGSSSGYDSTDSSDDNNASDSE